MSTTSNQDSNLINAFRAAALAFLSELDSVSPAVVGTASERGPVKYDPLLDRPPFTPSPKPSAPEEQQQLASITYLGAIARVLAEEGRGANTEEISRFARKAGYSGGNAVNGWNWRAGSPRPVVLNDNGERFLIHDSLLWIQRQATELGIELLGTYETVDAPDVVNP